MNLWKKGIVTAPVMALLILAGLLSECRCLAYAKNEFVKMEKQRVIVLTDISNEPDDEQSMVRFLVYSNEYDVEGMIATTSVWLRDKVRPDKIREREGIWQSSEEPAKPCLRISNEETPVMCSKGGSP